MKDRPYWQRFLVTIFPTVKRAVNVILIYALKIFQSTIKTIRHQI